jgi:hypothetical protein
VRIPGPSIIPCPTKQVNREEYRESACRFLARGFVSLEAVWNQKEKLGSLPRLGFKELDVKIQLSFFEITTSSAVCRGLVGDLK